MAPGDPKTRSFSKRHGLTLIEVLIALGLVLALTALVLPTASWVLRMGALDSARDGVEATLLQARAQAKITGRSIAVKLVDDRIVAEWFAPDDSVADQSDSSVLQTEGGQLIEGSWAQRRIPQGIEVLALATYREKMDALNSPLGNTDEDSDQPLDSSPGMRVAVFLPDGGALVGTPVVLVGERGDALLLSIDPWTGRAHFEAPALMLSDDFDELEVSEDVVEEDVLLENSVDRLESLEPTS